MNIIWRKRFNVKEKKGDFGKHTESDCDNSKEGTGWNSAVML
jgi:hypothetical protein